MTVGTAIEAAAAVPPHPDAPSDRPGRGEWARIGAMAAVIAALFGLGFALLAAAVPHHYRLSGATAFGFGTGMLALTLGIRHAFDADHISAIDNTTRKLMAEGKRPTTVGFAFSLGHSTVVLVLTVLVGAGVRSLDAQVHNGGSGLHRVAGLVGTLVSGTFLYVIAALNVVVLVSVLGALRGLRDGRYDEAGLERRLAQRGFMNRIFGPLARRVDRPWKMYPVGILFGLGFDTATEVSLLVLSGTAVAGGLPFWAILSLPVLFAAGMCLFDTLDSCFMSVAYGWAFEGPVRKLYYNAVITGLSVAVAVIVGTIELVGLAGSQFGLHGGIWGLVGRIDINSVGFVVVGLFIVTWLVALAVWRWSDLESSCTTDAPSGTVLAFEGAGPDQG